MKRLFVIVVAALAGIGAGTVLSVTTSATSATSDRESATAEPSFPEVSLPPGSDGTVVLWTPGGLPERTSSLDSLGQITAVTVVRGDLVELSRSERADGTVVDEPDGQAVIPLDGLAIDPVSYARALPIADAKTVATLQDHEALLSETSAELRRLEPGDSISLGGGPRYTIAAVVPDQLVAGSELVLTIAGGEAAGIDTDRYALITYTGGRADLEAAIHRHLGGPLRLRSPGETPFLRHGDAVLTQAQIKERFGEFSYRRRPDGVLLVDEEWERTHLVTTDLPVLGTLRCHRGILEALRGAMLDLRGEGLEGLVDPDTFGGCWSPRLIGTDAAPSRHTWGVAVDFNVTKNPTGLESVLDQRVVRIMERHGFTWGGRWLIPDPGHFEYHSPPGQQP